MAAVRLGDHKVRNPCCDMTDYVLVPDRSQLAVLHELCDVIIKGVLGANFGKQESKQTMASEVMCIKLAILCLEKPKKNTVTFSLSEANKIS